MAAPPPVRLAVRAVILREGRLLLVNAWKGRTHLWTCPGGGVEPHASLPDNLAREVMEETGLTVAVGAPCLVNEFHDPKGTFHQVDLYFRCAILAGDPDGGWSDTEGVVSHRAWATRDDLASGRLRAKPDSLAAVAWADGGAEGRAILYDPLEPILR